VVVDTLRRAEARLSVGRAEFVEMPVEGSPVSGVLSATIRDLSVYKGDGFINMDSTKGFRMIPI
jgi:hypothetical protein